MRVPPRLAAADAGGTGTNDQSASLYPYTWLTSSVPAVVSIRIRLSSRGDSRLLTTEATAPFSNLTMASDTSSNSTGRACRTAGRQVMPRSEQVQQQVDLVDPMP